jgi:hypothetical protein
LAADKEGQIWCVSDNKLYLIRDEVLRFRFPILSFPGDSGNRPPVPRALFPLKNETFVLEEGKRLLRMQQSAPPAIAVTNEWIDGAFHILGTRKDGSICVQSLLPEPTNRITLLAYDGTEFRPLSNAPPESVGKELSAFFETPSGDQWVGGNEGVAWYHDHQWRAFPAGDQSSPQSALGFTEVADGRLWCATQENSGNSTDECGQ